MDDKVLTDYDRVRAGQSGYYPQERGLIAVWGSEAVPFLDGLITNDIKKLVDGEQMLAAFPNAQGRLLAVVRVVHREGRFLFETESATRQKIYDNLIRFTFAGDFFVEDLSANFRFISIFGKLFLPSTPPFLELENVYGSDYFLDTDDVEDFITELSNIDAVAISDELYETLRIESGIPKYGFDMDENTIVPELGLDGLISYNKGCYIGQEIIARIHFRGHVAKQLAGVILSEKPAAEGGLTPGAELAKEGKNAGRITSAGYSPKLDRMIALAFVRFDFLKEGTQLLAGESTVVVSKVPFEL